MNSHAHQRSKANLEHKRLTATQFVYLVLWCCRATAVNFREVLCRPQDPMSSFARAWTGKLLRILGAGGAAVQPP